MKEKIIAAIKAKYPAINLSKTRLNAIAVKIEAKVIDDESKIDAALETYNEYNPLTDIAKADDKVRELEAKVKAPKKEGETPEEKLAREQAEAIEAAKEDKDTPAYVKQMMAGFESIKNELAAIKGEKVATSIKGKLEKELLKDVPVQFWEEWKLPENEDGLQPFAEKVTAKFSDLNKQRIEAGLSALSIPAAGGGPAAAGDGKIDPAIKAHYEQKAKQQPAATQN